MGKRVIREEIDLTDYYVAEDDEGTPLMAELVSGGTAVAIFSTIEKCEVAIVSAQAALGEKLTASKIPDHQEFADRVVHNKITILLDPRLDENGTPTFGEEIHLCLEADMN